ARAGLERHNLSSIGGPTIGKTEPPRAAKFPLCLRPNPQPVLLREFVAGQRRPQSVRRRPDVGDIDEAAPGCVCHGWFPSRFFLSAESALKRGRSNLRIQRSAIWCIGTGL